jgi:membrane protease YdiL (CAAX protease family)
MGKSKSATSEAVSAIALAVTFTSAGFMLRVLIRMLFDVTLSKEVASVLNFALAIMGAYLVFPKGLKQPFGEVSLSEYSRRLGVYWPSEAWKHIVLGIILALCTLSGLLASALLSGRYVLDWSTLSFSHTLFSVNPGVWEEFFFRGIIMLVLLKLVKSVRRAAAIQIVIFALSHIGDFEFWSLVDVVSVGVIAIAFTYAAYKTRTLIAGMVFHFLHDTFIYFVQVPGAELTSLSENLVFYAILWIMVGVACWLTKMAAEKFAVQGDTELYQIAAQQVEI